MKTIDSGYRYELSYLDQECGEVGRLDFVKRIGDGNDGPVHAGTTTQEVLRVLIDRTKHLDGQQHHVANTLVVSNLRAALRWLEVRAAEERGDDIAAGVIIDLQEPELAEVCAGCGHLCCTRSHT